MKLFLSYTTFHIFFFLLSLPLFSQSGKPGFFQALDALYPALGSQPRVSADFKPRVGGMVMSENGELIVSTWSTAGSVYRLSGSADDSVVARIAAGLGEPLGLAILNHDLYAVQRQELTRMRDTDKDGFIDTYESVTMDWTLGPNYHEFAFGLPVVGGKMMVGLALAAETNGTTLETQSESRGKILAISPEGKQEIFARGLCTPNGLANGPDGSLLIVDNLSPNFEASRLLLARGGEDFGFVNNAIQEGTAPPLLWFPRGTISGRPGQPLQLTQGPFAGQLLIGDLMGGIRRVSLQSVEGQLQACLFRFSQGLPTGVYRLLESPQGTLFAGGLDGIGNWGFPNESRSGLEELTWNEQAVFDFYAVEARANGILVHFTEPLQAGAGARAEDYFLQQWAYEGTGKATPPVSLEITGTHLSADRKTLFLAVSGLEPQKVLHLQLLYPPQSESGQDLWTNEAWLTLHQVPSLTGPTASQHAIGPNQLTEAEKSAGWQLLFDGNELTGWRTFQQQIATDNWGIQDDAIYCNGGRKGDLITEEIYDNFELELEWKLSPGGNSGVFFHVAEGSFKEVYHTGPEIQILDDETHPDGADLDHRSGANYDMQAAAYAMSRPIGEYNRLRVLVEQGHVTQWLNGVKVVEYQLGSKAWREQLDNSKFMKMPGYGTQGKGHIALQDHGNPIWFRNLKIRKR